MGRHRDSGSGARPVLAAGGSARSHRRPPGVSRTRVVSLVAAGALAGGVAIVGTTMPWFHESSQFRPGPRAGGPEAPGGHSDVPVAPTPGQAGRPVAAPVADPTPRIERPAPTVWRADVPGAFRRTPWNTVGTLPPLVGGDAVAFHLTGRGQRSELEPDIPTVREGDQHDVTFSVRLDGPAPQQVITRWENDGPGQAPLDVRVQDGGLVLHGGGGHPSGPRTFTRELGPAPVGEWTQLRVRVRFSADPGKASVSVWRDGRSVVDDERPRGGTLYPGQQSYLKAGLHRDRTVARPSTVQFRAWRLEHGPAQQREEASSRHRTADAADRPDRSRPSGPSHGRSAHADDARETTTRSDDEPSDRGSRPDRSDDRSAGSRHGSGHRAQGSSEDSSHESRGSSGHQGSRSGTSAHERADRSSSGHGGSAGSGAGDGGGEDRSGGRGGSADGHG
jgi:hypothetical protein